MTTKQVTIGYESKEDFESARCDLTIDTTTSPGTVRLSPSVLVQDEIGNGLQKVLLSDTVRAKKELILESAKATWVQVITFGGPAKISINGHEAEQITHQEDGGWHHADVPADWLRPGVNEIVLWGGGELWIGTVPVPEIELCEDAPPVGSGQGVFEKVELLDEGLERAQQVFAPEGGVITVGIEGRLDLVNPGATHHRFQVVERGQVSGHPRCVLAVAVISDFDS